MPSKQIKTYAPGAFTARYMPSEALVALLRGDFERFFILKVEEMYRHVKQAVPASRATNHTCIFITEGSAHMKIGHEAYAVGEGELLFVPAGQVFSFGANDVNKGYLCCFNDQMLLGKLGSRKLLQEMEFLKVWGTPLIRPGRKVAAFILGLLQRLHQEYLNHGSQHTDMLSAYLIALLCEAKQVVLPQGPGHENAAVQLTRRFRELLANATTGPRKVSEYAALLHVSPNHLNKAVKGVSGKTPTRWIDEAVVTEARILLWQTGMTIGEIAAELGFDDASYFARLFRKYEGVSPTTYRDGLKSTG